MYCRHIYRWLPRDIPSLWNQLIGVVETIKDKYSGTLSILDHSHHVSEGGSLHYSVCFFADIKRVVVSPDLLHPEVVVTNNM